MMCCCNSISIVTISMCTTLDNVAPLKRKVDSQKRLASWYNSQLCALKQTTSKVERQWRSSNLEEPQLVWKDSLITYKKALCKARTAYYPSLFTTVILYYWVVPQILWKASSWYKKLQPKNRRDHISPVLASLHWLPVKFRIEFKVLLLTYKALNDRALTSYLKELIVRYSTNRALHSQTAGLLVVLRVSKSRMGGRAFSYQAPLL